MDEIRKIVRELLHEHYVDTSWSRDGLEPSLQDGMYPITFENPNMMMPGAPAKLEENAGERTIEFIGKHNPSLKIIIKISRDGRISEIENEMGLRFPYSVGQPFNRGLETWACNNKFLMDGEDTCPEEKIFGIRKSDYPQGHPVRLLYPGKFR